MLVSVVIPCYNLGRYLDDCIESIRAQKLDPSLYEVIVIDDCSTDDSRQIALGYFNQHDHLDCKMSVFWTPQNLYLAGALNYGIERARGKYILPLDADNMLGSERTLEILSSALDKGADVAYGGLEILEDDGRRWRGTWPPEFKVDVQLGGKNSALSSSMFTRRVWERVGGYRKYCRTAEDALFWTQATALGFKFVRATEAVTLVYRNRPTSMSHVEAAWKWWTCAPGKELWTPSTHEPVELCIVVEEVAGVDPMRTFDSLWAQDFDRWECYFVSSEKWATQPWVRYVGSFEQATTETSAKKMLRLEAGAYFEDRDVLGYMIKNGEVETMPCGSCGSKKVGGLGAPKASTPRLNRMGVPRGAPQQGSLSDVEETVLVEYIGGGGMTMKSRNHPPQQYYFSSSVSHRVKRVYKSDAEYILRHSLFRPYTSVEDVVSV